MVSTPRRGRALWQTGEQQWPLAPHPNLCLQLEPATERLQPFPLCLPLLCWNLNKLGLLFPAWLLLRPWPMYSILYGFV